jgi:hypothetical protein
MLQLERCSVSCQIETNPTQTTHKMNTEQNISTALCRVAPLFAAIALAGAASVVLAAEHPEHPSNAASGSGMTASSDVSLDDVAKFTEDYVAKQSKNGALAMTDKAAGNKKLALKLDHVHRDRLSRVGPDLYFVCADFKTVDGAKTYDLDFFVQGPSKDSLKVVPGKTSVHKENGNARYTWMQNQKTGTWEQKPVGSAPASADTTKKSEHPEHPKN